MKASKFTDAQKAFIIKQGEEGTTVAEICRKAGISQATYFNWSAGGLEKRPVDGFPTKQVRRHVANRYETATRARRREFPAQEDRR